MWGEPVDIAAQQPRNDPVHRARRMFLIFRNDPQQRVAAVPVQRCVKRQYLMFGQRLVSLANEYLLGVL